MKNTKKIMAGVVASMMLPWPISGAAATRTIACTDPQENTQADEKWKSDPEVLKNADAIFGQALEGVHGSNAKTLQEIANQFPKLSQSQVEQALKRLIYDGRVHRQGDGSQDKPFRYTQRYHGGGG
jgi:hypothetical protein